MLKTDVVFKRQRCMSAKFKKSKSFFSPTEASILTGASILGGNDASCVIELSGGKVTKVL
jgi:hypothetical protein